MNYWRYNPDPCNQFTVIDLRTSVEVSKCPALSDINLEVPLPPLSPADISEMAHELYSLLVPNQCIKIFCAKGKRSAVAVAILKQAGFENVIDLGGIECK
jgi:rhodanese-related sulfurtransferase